MQFTDIKLTQNPQKIQKRQKPPVSQLTVLTLAHIYI